MRTVALIMLACLIAAPPAHAQSPLLRPSEVPAPALSSRETARRAVGSISAHSVAPPVNTNWFNVVDLEPGSEIIVITDGAAPRRAAVIAADDTRLVVLDLDVLPADEQRRLTELARRQPSAFAAGHTAIVHIPRPDVAEVRVRAGRRGSVLGAVIGAAAGGFLGVVQGIRIATRDCEGSCTDEKVLLWTWLIGAPVAGGVAGYYLPDGQPQPTAIYIRSDDSLLLPF